MTDTKYERKSDSKQKNNEGKHKWENIPTKIQSCQILKIIFSKNFTDTNGPSKSYRKLDYKIWK